MNKKEFKKLHPSKTKSWMKKDSSWQPTPTKGLIITDSKTGKPVPVRVYAERQKSKAREEIMKQFPSDMKPHRKIRLISNLDERLKAREKAVRDNSTPTRRPRLFVDGGAPS